MSRKVLIIMCVSMFLFTACGKDKVAETEKVNAEENKQDDDSEIKVETEYGSYMMDAVWSETQEGYSDETGFSYSYWIPNKELSNSVTVSYTIMPEDVDMSDHEVIKERMLKNMKKSVKEGISYPEAVDVRVEDYSSKNHEEVFLFTLTDNQGFVVYRRYSIMKDQVLFDVEEEISIKIDSIPDDDNPGMPEISDRIAKRALETFEWKD